METIVTLLDGSEHKFQHVANIQLVPGMVTLMNGENKMIGVFPLSTLKNILQPDADTEISLVH